MRPPSCLKKLWVGWVAHEILFTAQRLNSFFPFFGFDLGLDFGLGLGLGLVKKFKILYFRFLLFQNVYCQNAFWEKIWMNELKFNLFSSYVPNGKFN